MKNSLNQKVKKDTKVIKNIFKAREYALEVNSYYFEVFDKDKNLIGYGIPK